MEKKILRTKKEGDSIGGVVECVVKNCPVGLGEPVFDKLHADLGKAMLGINAVKGFEIGSGFEGVKMTGSIHNDEFYAEHGFLSHLRGTGSEVRTRTNYSGGIQGGISNGEDIYFRVAFKPVSTIMKKQMTVNSKGEQVEFMGKGRHDPCVGIRATPIAEALLALVVMDHALLHRAQCGDVVPPLRPIPGHL